LKYKAAYGSIQAGGGRHMERNKRVYPISEEEFNRKVLPIIEEATSGKGVRPKYPITRYCAGSCIF
jgi:hypothetical protein